MLYFLLLSLVAEATGWAVSAVDGAGGALGCLFLLLLLMLPLV